MLRTATRLASGLVLAACAASGWTDEGPARVTFTKDILPILQENCQTCHRPAGMNLSGMIAPMSLMTYQEVRPWAKAIAKAVESRAMPPWHASPETNGLFSNERTLTDTEIAAIQRWVQQKAPRGNPKDAPRPMKWSNTGWNFGEPDLIAEFDKPFFVPDEVEDLYQDITVELTKKQLPGDRWLSGIEFKPGSEVVHHIIGHAHAPGQEQDRRSGMLGGNAPGADQSEFPEGFGILLKEGSSITFAMHYHKESGSGTGVWDSSKIGFKFHTKPVDHPVTITAISHHDFEIPPYHPNWRVGASRTFEQDTWLLNMLPHTHLRGTSATYTAFYPDGTVEQLLNVPQYDFNWQTGYGYKEMKLLPAGTRLEMELYFDNSEENAAQNGFNPARAIRFGGPTTDEMDLAWISVTPVEPMAELRGGHHHSEESEAGD